MINNLKEIKILDFNLSYYEENNKRKKTILFIHGFHSSVEFIKKIIPLSKNFNVIALNLPGSKFCDTNKEITLNIFNKIVKKFIREHIKTKKLIVLGHSLGGAIASSLYNEKKVKKIIFMAPLNPSMINDSKYNQLKNIVFPKNTFEIIKKKAITKFLLNKFDSSFVNAFIDENSNYSKIVKNNILSKKFMEITLYKNYLMCNKNKKTYYLIGKLDRIINPKLFKKFVNEELNKEVKFFGKSMHNIIKNQPNLFLRYLNEKFYSKKTIFK
jgi:esterase/lipase